jgi:hypothetical protein
VTGQIRTFFSYSHQDKMLAERVIKRVLELAPIKVINLPDDERLLPGEKLLQQIAKQIEESDAVVFLISQNFAASNWLRSEMALALAERKRGKFFLPVLFSSEADIPYLIKGIKYIDFRNPEKFNENIETLASTLRNLAQTGPWGAEGNTRELSRTFEKYVQYSKQLIQEDYQNSKTYLLLKHVQRGAVAAALTAATLSWIAVIVGFLTFDADTFTKFSGVILGVVGSLVGYVFGARSRIEEFEQPAPKTATRPRRPVPRYSRVSGGRSSFINSLRSMFVAMIGTKKKKKKKKKKRKHIGHRRSSEAARDL